MPADRHGWNHIDNFFFLFFGQVEDLLEQGFVVEDDIHVRESKASLTDSKTTDHGQGTYIEGRLLCRDHLFVDVEIELSVTWRGGRQWVRIAECKYHAGILGDSARTVFRYDNAHPYPEHPDSFHKHVFDATTWQQVGMPIWIGRENWPQLSEVLEELREWWESTGRFLKL